MKKRGIVWGDPHCAHLAGLTPPAWQTKEVKGSRTKRNKWFPLQREMWYEHDAMLKRHGPFDFAIFGGDGIDGKGAKSGGTELITADREEQVDMAVACCDHVRQYAKKGFAWVGINGTAYHGGAEEDWENLIAERAGFKKMGAHEWVEVNGCILDIKHYCGSSSIPHGRHTAVAKERLWNLLWAERELQPKSNVILRFHVHYHNYCGGPGWVAMTCPALQAAGTKYGARRCSGTVDWGVVIVEIDTNGDFDWHADTVTLQTQKPKIVRL